MKKKGKRDRDIHVCKQWLGLMLIWNFKWTFIHVLGDLYISTCVFRSYLIDTLGKRKYLHKNPLMVDEKSVYKHFSSM